MTTAGHHSRSMTTRWDDPIVSPAATDRPARRVTTAVRGAITSKDLVTGSIPRRGSGHMDAEAIAHIMRPKAPPRIHRPAGPSS